MVRLKAINKASIMGNITKFQFHNGSIKRSLIETKDNARKAFQFHNGSIKSSTIEQHNARLFDMFQFHNGSIKSKEEVTFTDWEA